MQLPEPQRDEGAAVKRHPGKMRVKVRHTHADGLDRRVPGRERREPLRTPVPSLFSSVHSSALVSTLARNAVAVYQYTLRQLNGLQPPTCATILLEFMLAADSTAEFGQRNRNKDIRRRLQAVYFFCLSPSLTCATLIHVVRKLHLVYFSRWAPWLSRLDRLLRILCRF